ncbi:MerR family transcriptional regulator [Membranihabitans maritimus]|uniref:MerR family transcriptional regulator n=1 Tax=Membranihabitans maritimus TaxID=2904244 RepID=UPI001F3A7F08
MINYSISDLETITGIKAHTLRVWEKRYGVIEPKRTPSNIRYYNEADMKKLLDIVLLYNNGFKISQIASLTSSEIEEELKKLGKVDENIELRQDCITASVMEFNEEKFKTLFENYERKNGLIATMTEYILPFLDNSSLLYMSGTFNLAHENFITQIVKRKLIAGIEDLEANCCNSKGKVLIFLPSGEYQELYLAYMEYICRYYKFNTVNLGLNLGFEELECVSQQIEPDLILTMIHTEFKAMSTQNYFEKLNSIFPGSKILATGCQVKGNSDFDPEQFKVIGPVKGLNEFFEKPIGVAV